MKRLVKKTQKLVKGMPTAVVLKNKEGKQIKVPLQQLSGEDQKIIQLETPPRLEISFSRTTDKRIYTPDLLENELPSTFFTKFGASVKQTSSGSYDHELKAELFAIGAEVQRHPLYFARPPGAHLCAHGGKQPVHQVLGQ